MTLSYNRNIHRAFNLEFSPVLNSFGLRWTICFLKVMTANYHVHIVPQSGKELKDKQHGVPSVIEEPEL